MDLFTIVICVAYPIWRSYKVVEAKKYDKELILWLSFWMIHASIVRLEDFLVLGIKVVIPELQWGFWYRLLRLTFFTWLIHPNY